MLATMILWTSCSSVLMLPRFLLARLSMYDFLVFWISRLSLTKLNEGVGPGHGGHLLSVLLVELRLQVFEAANGRPSASRAIIVSSTMSLVGRLAGPRGAAVTDCSPDTAAHDQVSPGICHAASLLPVSTVQGGETRLELRGTRIGDV
ncbi:hypothetical protein EYF80_035957 [Liparis tanakae]|uniref:Uncharacterized protein n=1 Tax=Liparis tanakae TaxID=230148 RepID=A0A4Z2GMC6_9TELE|nr:hypothetical protein EYF80_035957 [Liparis tanakae]